MRRWPWPASLAVLLAAAASATAQTTSRGEALYTGTAPMSARLAGHSMALPAATVVCAHCHGARSDKPTSGGDRSSAAPTITGGALSRTASRRNGPPAAYDAVLLCHALRTGIDPAEVLLPSGMPRFDVSDEDCLALWRYLNDEAVVGGGTAVP